MKKLVLSVMCMVMVGSMTACGAEKKNEMTESKQVETITLEETTQSIDGTETVATEENISETEATVADAVEKQITITVVNQDGTEEVYDVATEADFLLEAMETVEGLTFDGTKEDWGYSLTTINGLYADYEKDGAYWAVYVNDQYGQYAVDAQPVADQDAFKFVYEVYVTE